MRLVRILTRPNLGGPMLQAIQLWHAMRALGVRTVLVVGQCQPGESAVDLRACGIPLLGWHDLAPDCEGILPLPQLSNSWPWLGERAALQRVQSLFAAAHFLDVAAALGEAAGEQPAELRVVVHDQQG